MVIYALNHDEGLREGLLTVKTHQKIVYTFILVMLILLVLFFVTSFLFPNIDPFEYVPATALPTQVAP
jgi:lipopolysaccharide export LptBFGC system permease protein LptF